METKLTPRDVWILSLLPLAAAVVLAWMWTAPLCREVPGSERHCSRDRHEFTH